MNDNLNENAMPITMEDTTPEPEHHVSPSLINVFLTAFEKHIDMLVETKFNAMLQNKMALTLLDEALADKIEAMVADAIDEHENDHAHPSDEDIENEVDHHLEHFVRQGSHEFITERELSEKVSDVLDEILDDRINSALSGATVEISV